MTQPPELRSRIAGSLLGGALAEASTATSGRSFADATQLALYTVDGLTEALEWANDGVAADETACLWLAYLRWLRTQGEAPPSSAPAPPSRWLDQQEVMRQRRNPDPTNLSSLAGGQMGSRQRPLASADDGPGALQRSAPFGLLPNVPAAMMERLALDAAAITHGHPDAQHPSAVLAGLVHEIAIRKQPLPDAVRTVAAQAEALGAGSLATDLRALVTDTGSDDLEPPGQNASQTLCTAIRLALTTAHDDGAASFSALLTTAAASGESSRVAAALAGNIVGAVHGIDALPQGAIDTLEGADVVVEMASRLAASIGA
ncbi:ADP-ribosylglycohydrolase [Arthrobacter pigmenti]|uniref:ADP-ribosylglycohydrolase n=1 Tax=Arthrobacter pigmenti TaxID=271432 RepID=A0A846RQD5_9MICC|nr:ADP-ribosylglycohydrolase [Arthrobacter pigmenti]